MRLLDVVLNAAKARAVCLEVEQEVCGPRIAVSRLADRAGIEERPHTVEGELGAGRSNATREVGRQHDLQRDVAVADEHERRAGELECCQRALVVEDVLPDRVAGRAVVERDAVGEALRFQAVEESLRLGRQNTPGPGRGDTRLAAELLEVDRPPDREVVIPRQADVGPLRDRGAALVRSRPVADEIAEAPELVRRLLVDRREDRLQRVQVRVDV